MWSDRVPGPVPESPRIQRLREALAREGDRAREAFWHEMEVLGTPLREPAPDPDHELVTFLFRGRAETRHALVAGDFWVDYWWNGYSESLLHRLADTDVWFRTYLLPKAARFDYVLHENAPLVHPAEAPPPDGQPDPLNAHHTRVGQSDRNPEARSLILSHVDLSNAPPCSEAVRRDEVPAGSLDSYEVESRVLGAPRRAWVYRPPAGAAGPPPHLVVLFDGWHYTEYIPTATILDNLIATGRIPPTVVLMMDNDGDRMRELNGNRTVNRFLVEELLPWLHRRVPVTDDPKRTVVGGLSLGGVAAVFAALEHPTVFGNVLSQSGAFWTGRNGEPGEQWLADEVAARDPVPVRFHLQAGLFEETRDWFATSLLQSNRNLVRILRARRYDFHYSEFVGGHSVGCWTAALPGALEWLLGEPPLPAQSQRREG